MTGHHPCTRAGQGTGAETLKCAVFLAEAGGVQVQEVVSGPQVL